MEGGRKDGSNEGWKEVGRDGPDGGSAGADLQICRRMQKWFILMVPSPGARAPARVSTSRPALARASLLVLLKQLTELRTCLQQQVARVRD